MGCGKTMKERSTLTALYFLGLALWVSSPPLHDGRMEKPFWVGMLLEPTVGLMGAKDRSYLSSLKEKIELFGDKPEMIHVH
jgi:hypothetical protein